MQAGVDVTLRVDATCDETHASHAVSERAWQDAARSLGFEAPQLRHQRNDAVAGTLNLLASFVRATECILTPDCLLGCFVSVACTLYYWFVAPASVPVTMSWSIISLVIVFPISQGISMGFKRREQALGEFGNLLGNLRAIYGATHAWKVKAKDGTWVRCIESFEDPAAASTKLNALMHELLVATCAFFDTERWGRSRHVVGAAYSWLRGCGAAEQSELVEISQAQRLLVDSSLARLQRLVQQLKVLGLPGGEAHRLDSYVTRMFTSFERLVQLKQYRTPQLFRCAVRLCISMLPCGHDPMDRPPQQPVPIRCRLRNRSIAKTRGARKPS